ncbi:MAG: RNA polymerase factor sigma-54, partial [Desulfovibrionaceae bacterium]|nr:RNA polymerase factor sigma-54 [Desulfovibrionaceae bacterium]
NNVPENIRKESHDDDVYDNEIAKDAQWEDYLGEFSSSSRQMQSREFESQDDSTPFEARYAAKPTLEAHLLWQLHLSNMSETEIEIGEEIIGNLSSSGYLEANVSEIAEKTKKSEKLVEKVLKRIQLFDPVGVAARNAQECLLIQLKDLEYDRDPVLVDLVKYHLEDIEAKRYKNLLKKYSLEQEDLDSYINIIKSLEPMPGASYGDEEPAYICPDIYVYKVNDDFVIVLNDDGLPNLQISDLAEQDLSNATPEEKNYCEQKIKSASWLIKSLYQRQRTLYKVSESIVRHQRAFFEEGPLKLVPLILRDIADDIEMHESTISRITTNKYMSTPFGVFELKYFFNNALTQGDGNLVGAESVKILIKQIISEEDPANPFSDEIIAAKLKDKLNLNLARRTVAKYRTQLGIESSSKRKVR